LLKQTMFAVCAMGIALVPELAMGADCFTDSEWRAAHVRVLQSELNVAQLECGNVKDANYDVQYQSFVNKFKDRLKADATALRAHFRRVFGKASDSELDKYVTKLANDASARSMTDLKFCANSASLFQSAMAIDTPNLEQASIDRVTDHSEVGDQCPEKATVIKASVSTKGAKSSSKPAASSATKAAKVIPASTGTGAAPATRGSDAKPAAAPVQSAQKPAAPKADSAAKPASGTTTAVPNNAG
jgi:hypothetical protein